LNYSRPVALFTFSKDPNRRLQLYQILSW